MPVDLGRRTVAEGLGTALLLATVVGSGIMGERLSAGNVAIALLANTLATGAALVALVSTFGPISGAHMNPAVTLASASQGELPWREVPAYVVAQIAGAFAGVAAADAMFDRPVFSASRHVRTGPSQWLSEGIATFGLLAVIAGCSRRRPSVVPFAVGAYITAAYWFTASTSFANPAVTLARAATDTFAGIRPADVPGFVAAQLVGAAVATVAFRWLVPARGRRGGRPIGGLAVIVVLFACVHNAGRSQMAAAWFDALSDPAKARALSAGTDPGARVHAEVIDAMREVGIDLASATPRRLTDDLARGADVLVTMGCGEACPVVPGVARLDWPVEDPKGKPAERVRAIRDEVRGLVAAYIAREGLGPPAITIGPAASGDLDAVRTLLAQAELPEAGLLAQFPAAYVVARRGGEVVGVAGLETYGTSGLLRSVVVAPALRRGGTGRALVADRLAAARARGLDAVYLLTTSAAHVFSRLGFSPAARETVPTSLAASVELSGACPASATCMALRLR